MRHSWLSREAAWPKTGHDRYVILDFTPWRQPQYGYGVERLLNKSDLWQGHRCVCFIHHWFFYSDHRCENLARTIPNGRVNIKPQNMFGGIATYECEWGYEIRGQKDRVCRGDEKWEGEAPSCVLSKGSGQPILSRSLFILSMSLPILNVSLS